MARARPFALIAVVALAACDDKCPAALVAASKAVWAYKPVDKAINDAWSASVELEKALDQNAYHTTELLEGNCHEIDRALVHPENADTVLLRSSAQAFLAEVVEVETDPAVQRDRAPFEAALATYAKGISSGDDHSPTAANKRDLKLLATSWCTLENSFHAALANRLEHIKAEQVKNMADIAKYGAQAKAQAAKWTEAQKLGKLIDDKQHRFPLGGHPNLDADPDFAGARAAVAAANAACK